jgi:FkbM family methyltransferase
VSVEAHPRTARFLHENVHLNRASHVRVHATAVGKSEGRVWISDNRSDEQNAVAEASGIEVPMALLDDLVPAGLPVRLLKIDVEGYERFVLEGARETLARTDAVYFEVSQDMYGRFGYSVDDVFGLLRECGFEVPVTRVPGPAAVENVLAVRYTHNRG